MGRRKPTQGEFLCARPSAHFWVSLLLSLPRLRWLTKAKPRQSPSLVVPRWFVSARSGEGLAALRQAIAEAALTQERLAASGRLDPRFDPDRSSGVDLAGDDIEDDVEVNDTTPEWVETLLMPPSAV